MGHDIASDQGGEVWHADEGKCGFHIAAQNRSFVHFRPGLQLPFNPEGIDIDQTGAVPSVPVSIELESSNATFAYVANKSCFFKGFPGRDLMGSEAPDGVTLGNYPASAAS